MAGNGVSGQFGDVKIGSTQVAETCKWNFSPKSNNPAYASNKTGGYKARVAGIKDGSGSIDGKYDPAEPIMAVLDVGTEVTLKLYLTATVFYSVPSIIDTLKINVDIDTGDIVSWTADFSTNGAWTNPLAGLTAERPDGEEAPPEEPESLTQVSPDHPAFNPAGQDQLAGRVADLVHAQLTMARGELISDVTAAVMAALARVLPAERQTQNAA